MKKKLYIHLGPPKTGSTYLQREVFLEKKFNYINSEKNKKKIKNLSITKVIILLRILDDSSFELKKKKLLNIFLKINLFNNKINILSDELFLAPKYGFLKLRRNLIRLNFFITELEKRKKIDIFFLIYKRNSIQYFLSYCSYVSEIYSKKYLNLKNFRELKAIILSRKINSKNLDFFKCFNIDILIILIKKIFKKKIYVFKFNEINKEKNFFSLVELFAIQQINFKRKKYNTQSKILINDSVYYLNSYSYISKFFLYLDKKINKVFFTKILNYVNFIEKKELRFFESFFKKIKF